MSQAVMEAPASTPQTVRLRTRLEDALEFRDLHEAGVDECIEKMLSAIQPGTMYKLVITPSCAIVRTNNSAPINEDFATQSCWKSIVMRELFREKCPHSIRVTFGFTSTTVHVDGQRVPRVMLNVKFFMPVKVELSKKKQ